MCNGLNIVLKGVFRDYDFDKYYFYIINIPLLLLLIINIFIIRFPPRRGIWREVMGMNWDTLSWKTVSDRRTVTPEK